MYLDKKGVPLKHGDFILWNPDDDEWLDVIVEYNGKLTTLYEMQGGELQLKDWLFGSENPVLRLGNVMMDHFELTKIND